MKKRILFVLCVVLIMAGAYMVLKEEKIEKQEIVPVSATVDKPQNDGPKVAITFDDGPSTLYTEKLLDGLKERGVHATFFLVGERIQYDTKLVERMYKEGHEIGNHTYTHTDLAKTNYDKARKEINDTNKEISDVTGVIPKFIRPPYGDWNEKLLEETEMSVVLWSVDPEDWKEQNAEIVAQRVIKSTGPGDIILLHDIFESSVEAAFKIIDKLQSKGYEFVTVDEIDSTRIISKSTYQNKK